MLPSRSYMSNQPAPMLFLVNGGQAEAEFILPTSLPECCAKQSALKILFLVSGGQAGPYCQPACPNAMAPQSGLKTPFSVNSGQAEAELILPINLPQC